MIVPERPQELGAVGDTFIETSISFSTTDPSTVDRTVDVTFSDAGGAGNTATTTIVINDAPTLDLDGSVGGNNFATTYTENGPAAAIADTDVIITDADNTTLFEATIR